jgi:hypothetical protein
MKVNLTWASEVGGKDTNHRIVGPAQITALMKIRFARSDLGSRVFIRNRYRVQRLRDPDCDHAPDSTWHFHNNNPFAVTLKLSRQCFIARYKGLAENSSGALRCSQNAYKLAVRASIPLPRLFVNFAICGHKQRQYHVSRVNIQSGYYSKPLPRFTVSELLTLHQRMLLIRVAATSYSLRALPWMLTLHTL